MEVFFIKYKDVLLLKFVFQKEDMVQPVTEGLVTPQRRGPILLFLSLLREDASETSNLDCNSCNFNSIKGDITRDGFNITKSVRFPSPSILLLLYCTSNQCDMVLMWY